MTIIFGNRRSAMQSIMEAVASKSTVLSHSDDGTNSIRTVSDLVGLIEGDEVPLQGQP
jgi:hypothetical protein